MQDIYIVASIEDISQRSSKILTEMGNHSLYIRQVQKYFPVVELGHPLEIFNVTQPITTEISSKILGNTKR